MRERIKNEQITKINNILSTQNEAMQRMRLFDDEDQNESLNNRSNARKDNYKYLQKISKAEDMVQQAKQNGQQKNKLIKNGILRRNVLPHQPTSEMHIQENDQKNANKTKNIPIIEQQVTNRTKIHTPNTSFVDRKAQPSISRIEQSSENVNEINQQVLPREIAEGDISKSIVNIDYAIVKKYFQERINTIKPSTSPQQIYRFMSPFNDLCGIKISLPLIKKYKNCVYFGNSSKSPQAKYEGFLILHEQDKIYYGQLKNQKKHGKGTQIDFKNDIVFIGQYSQGRKIGIFTVIKPHEQYVGQLLKGQYHGFGQLTTQISKYKGNFEKGLRHGQGQQTFLQMGLTICGIFVNNKFTNNSSQKGQQSRLNTINSRSQEPSQQSRKANSTPKTFNNTIMSQYPNTTVKSVNSNISKRTNPQNALKSIIEDKNVVFQRSHIARQNFQEFDCQFGIEQEQFDELQKIKTRKNASFRIKQMKQGHRHQSERKRDEQTSFFGNSIYKK